jgi:hypothetical protein
MIPPPFFSKPNILPLTNVYKIVPHLEQGRILIVVVTGLVTLDVVRKTHTIHVNSPVRIASSFQIKYCECLVFA